VCSVLFCDLVGFTPLSEARDPEEVRELLTRYFDAARTVIGRYGGTVEKFIGDAVMAVWGAPVAAEGDAERAVRAGLEIVDAVAHLGQQVGATTLAARGGVVTGEVAVTVSAVGQGMVAGDPVNTAARVQAAAEPGTVLVDDGTWRAARGAVTFTSAGEHLLKGKAEPVPLWRAERVVSGVGGSQRIDGLEAPLVGREVELRLIKELFHACAERRTARLVSIIGPAGVGKSRLGWEFEKYIDGLAAVVNWHRGHCLSYGDGVAFWALAEMVRQRLDIAEEDTTDVAAQKLTAGLDSWVPDTAAREYIRPRLARLLGVNTDTAANTGGGMSREELFAGWRMFFEQLATQAPVVLLAEDAQHADDGLLDFLEHLLDWSRDAPIFVLTLARPELVERRPGWGAGRRNGTVLTLEPLDDTATRAMLDGLVPGMPEPAKHAIAAQAQGIPLYAVETVRTLIDRDAVQPIDGVYRLVGDIGELAVPDSLQSLLAARLDALPPDARRLVGDAAVLGGRFPAEALIAISGQPAEAVRRVLVDLVRREVLAVSADPLSPERGQYAFLQTMVRQVAYDTLSRRDRKACHLAVAAHLQRVFADGGEEVSEVVARHLLDALAAVPDDPDVPDLRQRAVAALVRAAERAERTGAPATAARAYTTAADLHTQAGTVDDILAAAQLHERAGAAARVADDHRGSAGSYRRAAETYQRHGMARDAARARVGQARAARNDGRFDEAGPLLGEALTVLGDQPDADTVAALRELATLESSVGRDADQLFQKALTHAQSLGLPDDTIAELFVNQGVMYGFSNRPAQATAMLTAALTLVEGRDDRGAAGALLNLADVLLRTDPAAAAEAAGKAVASARRVGSRYDLPIAVSNLMLALLLTGQWDAAGAAYDTAVDDGVADEPYVAIYGLILGVLRTAAVPAGTLAAVERIADSQDPQDQATVALARAVDAMTHGDAAATVRHARTTMNLSEALSVGAEPIRWAWPLAADAALTLGDHAEVQRLLDWLAEHPRGHIPPLLRAEHARITAKLLAAHHDPAADDAYQESIKALRDLGSPYHLAIGLLDFADHLSTAGDPERARLCATEAGEIAERLGAQPLLRRAESDSSRAAAAAQLTDVR
jgi:class 3 adenylate cyclase/tetratricopeptide (TPR) repeat protein